MGKPLVSIIMAVYNGEKYVKETIDSILRQSYDNFELILIDDCSTDSTLDILQSYTDSRIKVYHNEVNRKLAASLNIGIKKASGKYIARMDADDLFEKNRLQLQVKYMETHPETDVLGGNYKAFDGAKYKSDYPQNHDAIKTGLMFENTVCHPAVMFRKDAIHTWYDESFAASQDYDLWTRLIDNHTFHNLKNILMRYRVHQGQTVKTASAAQKQGATSSRVRMMEKFKIPENDQKMIIEFCGLLKDTTFEQFVTYCSVLDKTESNPNIPDKKAYRLFAQKCIWNNVYHHNKSDDLKKIFRYCRKKYGAYFWHDIRMAYLIFRRIM